MAVNYLAGNLLKCGGSAPPEKFLNCRCSDNAVDAFSGHSWFITYIARNGHQKTSHLILVSDMIGMTSFLVLLTCT